MRLILSIIMLILYSSPRAQNLSVNKVSLNPNIDSAKSYQFLISGHFYGDGFNQTHYPANTVLGNIDLFNEMDFTICLGDLYKDVKNDHEFYKTSFYGQLTNPLFNAVGNHDVSGDFYSEHVAPTFFSFNTNGIKHIILDGETNDSKISGVQLDSFKLWLNNFSESDLKYLFIYSHRPIWAEEDSTLNRIFTDNTKSDFGTNFQTELLPLLNSIKKTKIIYWFSGSMGAQPYSFFNYSKGNITYAITAIRGAKRDAVLIANFNNGRLEFQTKSLTGEKLKRFEEYDLKLFLSYVQPVEINYRLIPLWIKNTVFHRYFWYGVLLSLITIFVLHKLSKKFR